MDREMQWQALLRLQQRIEAPEEIRGSASWSWRNGASVEDVYRILGAAAPARCSSCKALVWWFTHANRKRCPYDETGETHFVGCPDAAKFRRDR